MTFVVHFLYKTTFGLSKRLEYGLWGYIPHKNPDRRQHKEAGNMIRLGICDDDGKILEILGRMVESQYGEQIQIQTWNSSEELLFWCEEKGCVSLDVLLIDIVLQEGSGIELAKKLQRLSRRVKIIFITGHIEYATDIFQVEPVYLLKKPVSALKLVEAIDRAIEKIRLEEHQVITLHSKGMISRINVKYVSFIETCERKLLIHQNEDISKIYMKLDELEEKLGEGFLRCHHSYLVNMDYIKNFSSQEIELTDGTRIPVSRPKRKAAKKRFLSYLGEKI